MGAMTVQAKYERTTDPKRMMTHALLNEAIRKDWDAIKAFLPARTATYIRYEKGATNAVAWNEGGKETKIPLPLQDGWYVPDGNLFRIPNGKPSVRDNPDALYLVRYQDREYGGPLGRGSGWSADGRGRDVVAYDYPSYASGLALVGHDVTVAAEKLVDIDPKALVQRAEQLENAANGLKARLGSTLNPAVNPDMYAQMLKPILDEAAFLRELAGKIEAIRQKA